MGLTARLPALTHKHFRNWVLGRFISNLGTALAWWALFWHLDHLTGQPWAVGMVGVVRVGPLLGLGLFGGVVADQRDRRKIQLVTQSVMAGVALAMAGLTFGGHVTPAILYALIAVDAVARAYEGPVRAAIVANLVPNEHLANAFSINGIQWRLSEVLGPAMAGGVIAALGGVRGPAVCYLVNAVSFAALLLAVYFLPAFPGQTGRSKGAREVFQSILEGVRFLRQAPVIANAMWLDFWGTFLAGAQALLPAFVRADLHLGPKWYGLLGASAGLGALGASAVLALTPTIRRQGRWVIGMVGLFGLCTVIFGLSRNFWLAALFYAGVGASDMISTVLRQTIRQLAMPDNLRGRVSSIGMIFQISGPQLGDAEAAFVGEWAGVRTSLVLGGVGAMAVAAWYAKRGPALRDYEHTYSST